jgi:hypothetical protein
MAKTAATIIGIVFIIVGIAGFVSPNLLGAHLGTSHNVIHLVSGVISLYFGLKGSLAAARSFCIIFGIVYGLLGVAGLAMGDIEISAVHLMLGRIDHIIHVGIGVLYLLASFATKATTAPANA